MASPTKKIFLGALVLFICLIFIPTQQTHSQSAEDFNLYSAEDISLEVIPEIPGPYEEVTLRLRSFSFQLNNHFISWFLDGKQVESGIGSREFKFKTGASGEAKNVTAIIKVGTETYRKQFRFVPSTVDLLWEAIDSYTPPFYKGKALPLKQSRIKVAAIPETQIIEATDAPNLVYYWTNNDTPSRNGSGFGKQSFTFETSPLSKEEKIEVRVNDTGERSQAQNTIRIPIEKFQPKILFYELNEDGRLMTNRALNRFGSTTKESIKLSFHPLFFSTTQNNFTDLFIEWTLNNQIIQPQDFSKQDELNISAQGKKGEAVIGMTIEGIKKLFQKDSETLRIQFQ